MPSESKALTLLLVDDDELLLQSWRRVVPRYIELKTFSAPDLALRWMKGRYVDIVVSDLQLPGASGLSLLENVRKLVPLAFRVLVSGVRDGEAEAKKNPHLVDLFVSKPCSAVDVLRRLGLVLPPSSNSPSDPPASPPFSR